MSQHGDHRPSKVARWLLQRFLREDLAEEVSGDLDEKFSAALSKHSPRRAKLNYWYQVFHYLRPFALRKSKRYSINHGDMFQNYLKIGIRNLMKNKLFTLINVSGMAISIAVFMVIALFIYDELIFDSHLKDANLKYRVYNDMYSDDGGMRKAAMIPPMVAPTLAAEYEQVDYYTRFLNFNNPVLFEVGDKKMTEAKGGYADPSILEMFSLRLTEGDLATALREPNTIAISQTLKNKYFGDRPALGESIEIFNRPVQVVAVYEDFPSHSHLQLNFMLAMEGYSRQNADRMKRWGWSQFHTYIKLKPGATAADLEAALPGFAERNAWTETKKNGNYYIPHLMPIEKIHLYASDHLWDIAVRGNIQTVYILLATGVFILVIAILNFVNLSTARAMGRVKEVGVRKVMGAFRTQLIKQFISESVIIAFLALILGGLAVQIVLPYLNSFTEKTIPVDIFLNPILLATLILFALLVGVAAGAYPAFYISSYRPAEILSNKQAGPAGRTVLRKGLVVLQFILSFLLIIASIIVSEQHSFMRNTDMGFKKDNLVVVRVRGNMSANYETTKQAFSNHPNILSASLGYGLPGEAYAGDGIRDKVTGKDRSISMLTIDHDYIKTMGLEIVAGRDFSKDVATDVREAFILSEAAAKMLGHMNAEEALGHELAWNRWDAPDSLKEGKVIGVVKDLQLNSMREEIRPVVLHIFPFAFSSLTMRVKPEEIPVTIAHLEKTWKEFNPEWPFEYKFLDENFDKMYKSEEKLSTLFTFFTGFTIFVACLGLFGLVVYTTGQRYKEISIRKVLGATESGLVLQLGKSFVILIAIAFIIAIPFSYYAASEWLQKFAYRIPITTWQFAKAGGMILMLSLLTVGIQSLKAARTNPVDSLKEQ